MVITVTTMVVARCRRCGVTHKGPLSYVRAVMRAHEDPRKRFLSCVAALSELENTYEFHCLMRLRVGSAKQNKGQNENH